MNNGIKERVVFLGRLLEALGTVPDRNLARIVRRELSDVRKSIERDASAQKQRRIVVKDRTDKYTKYVAQNGSVYLTDALGRCRVFYDSTSGIATYEFRDGQIERTFPCGIKEVRYPDGSVEIRLAGGCSVSLAERAHDASRDDH